MGIAAFGCYITSAQFYQECLKLINRNWNNKQNKRIFIIWDKGINLQIASLQLPLPESLPRPSCILFGNTGLFSIHPACRQHFACISTFYVDFVVRSQRCICKQCPIKYVANDKTVGRIWVNVLENRKTCSFAKNSVKSSNLFVLCDFFWIVSVHILLLCCNLA